MTRTAFIAAFPGRELRPLVENHYRQQLRYLAALDS